MSDGSRRRARVVRLIPVLDFGGVESLFVLQAEHIDRERFDFRICTFWKDGRIAQRLREAGFEVDVLGVDPSIRSPQATLALLKYLLRERPDIVHASIGEANFHAALVGKLAGVRGVVLEEQGLPSRGPLGRAVHAMLYRLADRVVGVSDASCQYVRERELAPAARVQRIYNAATAEFFEPWSPRPAREIVELVTVGRLVEVKNQARLIEAFAPVAREFEGARLTIVGDGPLMEPLKAKIAALGLERQVSLPGFSSAVRQVLDAADAFLLPSLSEGMGIAMAEAMARGLPVVATTAGGAGEIAAPLGWAVAPTDVEGWTQAMRRLVAASPAEREAMGHIARARAEEFSPAAHMAQVHGLYEELLS